MFSSMLPPVSKLQVACFKRSASVSCLLKRSFISSAVKFGFRLVTRSNAIFRSRVRTQSSSKNWAALASISTAPSTATTEISLNYGLPICFLYLISSKVYSISFFILGLTIPRSAIKVFSSLKALNFSL